MPSDDILQLFVYGMYVNIIN